LIDIDSHRLSISSIKYAWIIAIYELWKSSVFVYYQITQLSEQKYRLAIPFAEHNFGPFGRNFSCSNRYQKHYFIVSFRLRASPGNNKTKENRGIARSLSVICEPVSSNMHLLSRYHISIKQQMLDWYSLFISSRRWDYRFQIKIKEFNA
jgi:hypothetical protein